MYASFLLIAPWDVFLRCHLLFHEHLLGAQRSSLTLVHSSYVTQRPYPTLCNVSRRLGESVVGMPWLTGGYDRLPVIDDDILPAGGDGGLSSVYTVDLVDEVLDMPPLTRGTMSGDRAEGDECVDMDDMDVAAPSASGDGHLPQVTLGVSAWPPFAFVDFPSVGDLSSDAVTDSETGVDEGLPGGGDSSIDDDGDDDVGAETPGRWSVGLKNPSRRRFRDEFAVSLINGQNSVRTWVGVVQ